MKDQNEKFEFIMGNLFSTQQMNYLKREGVHTIEDMLRTKDSEFIHMPMVGKKTLDKIRAIKNRCLGKVSKD